MEKSSLYTVVLTSCLLAIISAEMNLGSYGTPTHFPPYKQDRWLPARALDPPNSSYFGYSDGGTCSHSGGSVDYSFGYWRIKFPWEVFITTVELYYRATYGWRMDGITLSITNNPDNLTLVDICYKDVKDGTANIHQTFPCYMIGEYLMFSKHRSDNQRNDMIIELCYVEILGCRAGYFGSNCTQLCPANCLGPCEPKNGECVSGCIAGWQGSKCEQECDSGSFGAGCSETCDGCLLNKCHHITGECKDDTGCNPGYIYSKKCNQTCAYGYFGINCASTCTKNCLQPPCHYVTGQCDGGCLPGWTSDYCTKKCESGSFGAGCSQTCDGCLSNDCHHVSGECTDTVRCNPGYIYSTKCDKKCDSGHFGAGCSSTCDGCVSEDCHHVTGECTDNTKCNPGYIYSKKCEQTCNQWHYGQNCSNNCYCRAETCDSVTGLCNDGCDKGFRGDNCNQECFDGNYGYDCLENCTTCLNSSCEIREGICSYGCIQGYTGVSCLILVQAQQQPNSVSVAAIGGGLAASVLVIIAVVAGLIIIRKRRKPKRYEKNQKYANSQLMDNKKNLYENVATSQKNNSSFSNIVYEPEDDEDDDKDDDVPGENENVYNNVQEGKPIVTTAVLISELQQVISDKNENNGFEEEYQILPRGLLHSHIEGCKSENIKRNRFKTTFPYDHSRVVLRGETSTDYINANYIDSYTRQKSYIATQGPKKITTRDFWHMVWQENARVIVMVTNLVEGGVRKCDKYWPDDKTSPLNLDTYKITIKEERKHTVYVYRCITLQNKTVHQQRDIHHFHFTEWPDHGVADKIKLATFYRHVRTKSSEKQGPMIVHCSAGIGRTGTFIAIDALYRHGDKNKTIDVMEYAQMMRKDRMNMIQTKDQYSLVFEALLELFTVPNTAKSALEFCKYVKEQETLPSNQTPCRQQFQKLLSTRQAYGENCYSAAKLPENISKNYDKNVLPHNSYRPYLTSYEKGRNDYINAVIIPEYSDKKGFLVTQCPLKNTTVDFWTMVYDHDCHLVILLDEWHADAPLWKDNAVLNFTDFIINKDEETSETQMNIVLQHKKNETTKQVTVLTFTEWLDDKKIPKSSHAFLDLLRLCKEIQTGGEKVAVICRDGCIRSGLFVGLSLILEKFKLDDEIDIFQVIRTIQIRRPEFVSTFEQFQFCHTCMRDHLEHSTESLYANM